MQLSIRAAGTWHCVVRASRTKLTLQESLVTTVPADSAKCHHEYDVLPSAVAHCLLYASALTRYDDGVFESYVHWLIDRF